jgi:pimeloyl-ACP methyl ester carboxylesterase
MRANRITGSALALLPLLVAGCWNAVEEHCRSCTIVRDRTATLAPLPPKVRRVVILVHGAFGFGREWAPIVDAARARPDVALLAFSWGGPWTRNPSLAAEALRRLVQSAIDGAPVGADVLVIAHSAGGALAEYAAERLRVPATRRVRIASIAAPAGMNLAPFVPETRVNTPLGVAVGGEQAPLGAIAAGVDFTAYATADPPLEVPSRPAGARHVWLGARVGHNASVALAALPLLR